MITEVTNTNFQKEVLESKVSVVVDFWAEWCGPCKMMAPIFHKLADQFAGKMKFAKVNVDEYSDIAAQFGIRSIPTLLIFKNGKEIDRLVGAIPESTLKAKLEQVVK